MRDLHAKAPLEIPDAVNLEIYGQVSVSEEVKV